MNGAVYVVVGRCVVVLMASVLSGGQYGRETR